MTSLRRGAVAVALAAALPAAAYLLPVQGILKRMGERRAALGLEALSVSGTLSMDSEDAAAVPSLAALPRLGGLVHAPAVFHLKVPDRCRLELAPTDVPEPSRPFVAVRDGRLVSSGGLGEGQAAAALVRSACTLLGTQPAGNASAAYAAALARRGVAPGEVSLGRFDGRIAWVLGGRARDAKPLAWVEKDGFQPLRLLSAEGGPLHDVRLLGWGSPAGGDWFPRAVEVWSGGRMRLRLTTEKASPNPKLPDLLFP